MKRNRSIALLTAGLALALAPLHVVRAAEGRPVDPSLQQTGSISGRVQNVVTGQYLSSARVSVKGTDLVTFTDQTGSYRLLNVPGGSVVLDVFYTDLDPQSIAVQIPASQNIERDVELTSIARYGEKTDAVKLNPYVVRSSRETDAEAIAINERRFAPNIKDVVHANAYGDVPDGNLGEFMKFLPGVSVEYEGGTARGISVRGFSDSMTAISVDGAKIANVGLGGGRRFEMENATMMNSVSRIELTKVPTPATPADSMAGSVNLISKSAFERSRPEFSYRVFLAGNSDYLSLKKTPDMFEKYTYKIQPGFDFSYTLPISKNLGIVVTALHSDQPNWTHLSNKFYAVSPSLGSTISNPYLQTYTLNEGHSGRRKSAASAKVDWRFAPHHVLSFGLQVNYYKAYYGSLTRPTGVFLDDQAVSMFGTDFTTASAGRGLATSFRLALGDRRGADIAGNLRYVFDNHRGWKVEAAVDYSSARNWTRSTDRGQFGNFGGDYSAAFRGAYSQINPAAPGRFQMFDSNNQEIDPNDLSNYRVTTVSSNPIGNGSDRIQGTNLKVRRNLDFLPLPATLEVGGGHRIQTRDMRNEFRNWTYNGINGDFSMLPFQSKIYSNQPTYFGQPNAVFASGRLAWQAYQKDPSLFSETPANLVATESNRIGGSTYIREKASALYLQAEMRFLRNRLHVLTGVRYEKTMDDGAGQLFEPDAAFLRDAQGNFVFNAANQRIRRPEAGAAGSMEELRLMRRERGFAGARSYDGFYPSLHLNYNITDNLIGRLAYAKTYGRPDFGDVIPQATIDQSDLPPGPANPTISNTITVTNTGLRPWSADNYDLSLEYYTTQGGVFSVGAFKKDIKDFFGSGVKVATQADLTEFGLDSEYLGWDIRTKFNTGDARVTGVEFNINHSLRALGRWGQPFTVFASGSRLRLEGNRGADFGSFIPKLANWGVTFSRKPVTLMAKWNYQGDRRGAALASATIFGPDAYDWRMARVTLDLNLDYQIGSHLSVFMNGRNVANVPRIFTRYGPATPEYARRLRTQEFGVQLIAGVKGTF